MDEFEQSTSEKETNDDHNVFYQNPIHCEEREFLHEKKIKCSIFSPVFIIKPGRRKTGIFSAELRKREKSQMA